MHEIPDCWYGPVNYVEPKPKQMGILAYQCSRCKVIITKPYITSSHNNKQGEPCNCRSFEEVKA